MIMLCVVCTCKSLWDNILKIKFCMYFRCYVYKTSKLLNVFWIIGTHNVYKIIEVFMDIFIQQTLT